MFPCYRTDFYESGQPQYIVVSPLYTPFYSAIFLFKRVVILYIFIYSGGYSAGDTMSANLLKSVVLTLLLVPFFSACSFLIVEAPPVGYERFNYVPCTQSKVVPTLDAGIAAASTWLAMMAMTSDEFVTGLENGDTWLNIPGASYSKTGGILTFLSVGVLTGVSSGMGFGKVRQCREAVLEVAARNRQITAENQDGLPESFESAWLDRLFPLPTFSVDTPALPVTIPLMRK